MWRFLDGKKTKIGVVLMAIPVLWQGLQPILEVGGVSPEKAAAIGGIIVVVLGIAHKVLKAFGVAVPEK